MTDIPPPEPQRMTVQQRAEWLDQVDRQCDVLVAAAKKAGLGNGSLVFKFPNGVTIECPVGRKEKL